MNFDNGSLISEYFIEKEYVIVEQKCGLYKMVRFPSFLCLSLAYSNKRYC
uniref:Uncharacterized protein n=1 Tax=Meloidogyne enterolobii TaxID=390850 RepID=A0A6V7X7Y6_MELEN|nr:unnamed protein product [Meloidogyne enterolobii]